MDMESDLRPPSYTGQHLNGVGKFIQLKKEKDRAKAMLDKSDDSALNLPGSGRTFA